MDVVQILAHGDRDGDQWLCTTYGPEPFVGLFAWGPTFNQAREALAEAVWVQLAAGAAPQAPAARVRIYCTTRKTFQPPAPEAAGS